MNKTNIIIIFDDLFPGGALNLNKRIWNAVSETNKDSFTVITGMTNPQTIHTDTFPFADKVITFEIPAGFSEPLRFFAIFWNTVKILRKTVEQNKNSVVVANYTYSGLAAKVFCSIMNIPYIYVYHGSFYKERRSLVEGSIPRFLTLKFRFILWLYWLAQYTTIHNTQTVCFSEYAKTLLADHFRKTERVTVVDVPFIYQPAGITEKRQAKSMIGFDPNSTLLLLPSRIEPRKGQHLLTDALHLLHADRSLTVLLLGPVFDESLPYLSKILYSGNVNPNQIRLYFTNEIHSQYMDIYYKAADVTIVPSVDFETLGLVTLESLSCGTPVIGFDKGATSDILKRIDKRLIIPQVTAKSVSLSIQKYLAFTVYDHEKIQKNIKRYFMIHHNRLHMAKDIALVLKSAQT